MPLSESDQRSLHRYSSSNRAWLQRSQMAGCFYCLAIFEPVEVTEWVDERPAETGSIEAGGSALCPRCGIDSVLPSAAVADLGPELLEEMRAFWF